MAKIAEATKRMTKTTSAVISPAREPCGLGAMRVMGESPGCGMLHPAAAGVPPTPGRATLYIFCIGPVKQNGRCASYASAVWSLRILSHSSLIVLHGIGRCGPCLPPGGDQNPKSEIRNPKQAQNSKKKAQKKTTRTRHLNFLLLLHLDLFRISCFGFRIFLLGLALPHVPRPALPDIEPVLRRHCPRSLVWRRLALPGGRCPFATPRPALRIMGMSLTSSPMATICAGSTPCRRAT